MQNEEPMIYTTQGNLPVSSLRYETLWDDQVEYTKFIERYYLKDELVRESAHVITRKGLDMFGEQATF